MIYKVSSSEVFDIYASRMISKRASIKKKAGKINSIESILRTLEECAVEIGKTKIVTEALEGEARVGLRSISEAEKIPSSKIFEKVLSASHIDEFSNLLLREARICGYSGFTSSEELLRQFSIDLDKMLEEYKALIASSPNPNTEELTAFYNKHKKPIDFFNLIQKDEDIIAGIKKYTSTGRNLMEEGKAPSSFAEVEAAKGKGSGSTWKETMSAGSAIAGKAVGALTLFFIAKLAYNGFTSDSFQKLRNIFGSPDSEKHIQSVKDAIGCINNIALIPGSSSVFARESVIANMEKFIKFETVMNITDKTEFIETTNECSLAANQLLGDVDTKGSIQNFLFLVTSQPDKNLSGYTAFEGGSAGALAGGAIGFSLGGVIGAAIGAALLGYAGWSFMANYYSDEINCIASAGDAIVQFDQLFKDSIEKAKAIQDRDQKAINSPRPAASSSSGITKNSLLEQMIGVMQDEKIYNLPGLSNLFTNEKRLIKKIIEESGGTANAARTLSDINPNINLILSSIDTSVFSGAINEDLVKKNKTLQDLAKAIIIAAKNAKSSFRNKSANKNAELTNNLKIKEDYMKKQSKTINKGDLIRTAKETNVSYFEDANLGLKDQLTKSYYAGLTGMYNEQLPKKTPDYKDLYGFNQETGQDIILESHPKSVTLAEAMGKGGLVENNAEQQQKSIYVATKTPSGNFQAKYAQTIDYLQRLSKVAESQNKDEVSRLIKQTIKNLK